MTNSNVDSKQRILHDEISVDCVIFGFDFTRLNVLLVDRVMVDEITGNEVINDLTLTGNHIYEDEDLDDAASRRSEEHTSELQSRPHLVCRLLLEKKNKKNI